VPTRARRQRVGKLVRPGKFSGCNLPGFSIRVAQVQSRPSQLRRSIRSGPGTSTVWRATNRLPDHRLTNFSYRNPDLTSRYTSSDGVAKIRPGETSASISSQAGLISPDVNLRSILHASQADAGVGCHLGERFSFASPRRRLTAVSDYSWAPRRRVQRVARDHRLTVSMLIAGIAMSARNLAPRRSLLGSGGSRSNACLLTGQATGCMYGRDPCVRAISGPRVVAIPPSDWRFS